MALLSEALVRSRVTCSSLAQSNSSVLSPLNKSQVGTHLSANETATLRAFLALLRIASVSLVRSATEIAPIRSLNDAPQFSLLLLADSAGISASYRLRRGSAVFCDGGLVGEKVEFEGRVGSLPAMTLAEEVGSRGGGGWRRRADEGRGEAGGGEAERGRRRWGEGFARGLEGRPGGRMLLPLHAPASSDEFNLDVEGRPPAVADPSVPPRAPVAGSTTAASSASSSRSTFDAFGALRSALRRSPPESLNGPVPPLSWRDACAKSRALRIKRPSGAIARGSDRGGVSRLTKGGERGEAGRKGDEEGGSRVGEVRQVRQLQVWPGQSAGQRERQPNFRETGCRKLTFWRDWPPHRRKEELVGMSSPSTSRELASWWTRAGGVGDLE